MENQTTNPPAPDHSRLIDAANGRTLADLEATAREYRSEGYDVHLATNPTTGHVALYRGRSS